MRESYFQKKHFNLISKGDDVIKVQLLFSSNNDVRVVRRVVAEVNESFDKKILLFNFLTRSVTSSVFNSSSFNFVLITKSKLALFLLFSLLFRLNISFSVISYSLKEKLFSVNFFKAFIENKLVLESSKLQFINNFSEKLLFFFKKIEFYNLIRFLKLLKSIKK